MEPTVVLSDIHGNLEALQAVLARIEKLGIGRIFSLGDTIGYGPNPVECLRLARERFDLLLMGNHEYAALHPRRMVFNPEASLALQWTRERLEEADLLDGLNEMKPFHLEGNALYVHGSVKGPLTEYVQETDDRGTSSFENVVQELRRSFTTFQICFVGHNHKPFLATTEGFLHPHEEISTFCVTGEKLYVCVGSVGQPRDDDRRACFAVYDGERVSYHRVPYPAEQTAAKIRQTGLPRYLARRLLQGK
ncbi:Phosphoesterase [sediment metagenome]|uniref:Phosphoesterase n=1 Tax=sediment metagenome TaxID=749907 RepID=D9PLC1_9ZZZZ